MNFQTKWGVAFQKLEVYNKRTLAKSTLFYYKNLLNSEVRQVSSFQNKFIDWWNL